MDDVELECAVYGEATGFSVKIARDAKVSALQEAIFAKMRYNERYRFEASELTLYMAKKGGAWLKDRDNVEDFLRGEINKEYKQLRPSWKLENELLLHHVLLDCPTSTTVRSNRFKASLCAAYDCNMGRGKLRCMLLDTALPSELVIASRLFRRKNTFRSEKVMGISDIDDVRNGLLLFKPLEHALGHFQICFIYDQCRDEIRLKIYDPSVRPQRL